MEQDELIQRLKVGPAFLGWDDWYLVLMYHKDTYKGEFGPTHRRGNISYELVGEYHVFYVDVI